MKTIVITGGAGLLAVNWALSVRNQFSIILGIHLKSIQMTGVGSSYLDFDSKSRLSKQLEKIKPDLVVHTAGLTNVDECERRPEVAYHANVVVAENVAYACSYLKCPLVHISTDHLFAGDLAMVDESHQPKPRNIYGQTKAEAEHRVLESHSDTLVIRTNFYGWGPSYRRSFSDNILDGLRCNKTLNLYQDIFYSPLLIQTMVEAVHELLEKGARGVFHIAASDRISKYEFGLRIAREFGLDSSMIVPTLYSESGFSVDRPRDMSLSSNKAKTFLGREIGRIETDILQLRQQGANGYAMEVHKL